MHNIARHAAASHVIARLAVEGTMLRLSLHDDGRGFVVPGRLRAGANEATDDRANPNGHGLRNLAARARALGATLEIQSAPDRGTLVTLVTSWKTPPH